MYVWCYGATLVCYRWKTCFQTFKTLFGVKTAKYQRRMFAFSLSVEKYRYTYVVKNVLRIAIFSLHV